MEKFTQPDPPSQTAFPLARAGYPFIYAAAFVTGVFALLEMTGLALAGLLMTLGICLFFRDPDRVIPDSVGAVVSPADGKVVSVGRLTDSPFYDGPCIRIGIFMSLFNVHINRVPHEGSIQGISYCPGGFCSANREAASQKNEHNAVTLETEGGKVICFVQIAGLIARRIICSVQSGQTMLRGQRFGLICFGSRVDVYLPEDTEVKVAVGSRVKGGTSILGRLN